MTPRACLAKPFQSLTVSPYRGIAHTVTPGRIWVGQAGDLQEPARRAGVWRYEGPIVKSSHQFFPDRRLADFGPG